MSQSRAAKAETRGNLSGASPLWYMCTEHGKAAVKDQVHIRNSEAAQLARTLARQTGKTVSEVVLEALRRYHPEPEQPASRGRVERWRRLLGRDRAHGMIPQEIPVEALYDEDTGLPK